MKRPSLNVPLHGLLPGVAFVASAAFAAAAPRPVPPAPTPAERAAADASAQARQLLQEGLQAEKDNRLEQALDLYEQSYRAVPTPRTQWYIAGVCARLRLPIQGLRALTGYLEGTEEAERRPGQRQADAERLRGTLDFQVGQLRIVAPDGAEVRLDGQLVGRAPLADAIPVNPTRHRIDVSARALGYVCVVDVPVGRTIEKTCGPPPPRRPPPDHLGGEPPTRRPPPLSPREQGLINPWGS